MSDTIDVMKLTALDRCDRCGAQAYLKATSEGGTELMFCAHHAREHAPKLKELGYIIHDETQKLAAPASA